MHNQEKGQKALNLLSEVKLVILKNEKSRLANGIYLNVTG